MQPTFLFISPMINSTCVSVGSLVQSIWLEWRIQRVAHVISVPNLRLRLMKWSEEIFGYRYFTGTNRLTDRHKGMKTFQDKIIRHIDKLKEI